eukprot:3383451-Rhodomonas_salina.3
MKWLEAVHPVGHGEWPPTRPYPTLPLTGLLHPTPFPPPMPTACDRTTNLWQYSEAYELVHIVVLRSVFWL